MKAIECLRKKGSSPRLRKHPSRYAKVDREIGEVNEKNNLSEARHESFTYRSSNKKTLREKT